MSKELDFAVEAIKKAGRLTLDFFQNPKLSVDEKGDGSPVTQADKNAEECLRTEIQKSFPEDGIVGEEFGEEPGDSQSDKSGRSWIIDPIDGTVSFINGVPLYSTLLALGNREENKWDLGVIYLPALDELVYAERGEGCWQLSRGSQSPKQIRVSSENQLSNSVVVASGAEYVPKELIQSAKTFRTWGDGYGYMMLASGRADAMLDADLAIWDLAPMLTIIPEAGGEMLSWGAGEVRNVLGTNGTLSKSLGEHINLLPLRDIP